MRPKLTLRFCVAVFAIFAVASAGAADVAHVSEASLARFLTDAAPRELAQGSPLAETAAAIDGSRYAVIAPTYTGSDGNLSYVRLANTMGIGSSSAKSTTYSITVAGSPSGRTYGVAQIDVPSLASPQYSIQDILTRANAGALSAGDTGYALYLQDSDAILYQHVIFNGTNGFFEDVSICSAGGYAGEAGSDVLPLLNVHTSALTDYPAKIFLHNYQDQSATYRVTVTDARTGVTVGTVNLDTAANATYALPETFFEDSLHWTPQATQQHVNLLIQNATSGQSVNVLASQFIFNQRLAAYVNMSVACRVNAPAAATASQYQGTLAGLTSQSGTLTVSLPAGAVSQAVAASATTLEKQRTVYEASGAMLLTGKSSVALVGSYDTATHGISLVGGGFTFTGAINNGVIAGSYRGGNGISGGFSVTTGSPGTIIAYCGTYTGSTDSGAFNLQVSEDGVVTGVSTPRTGTGDPTELSGSLAGSRLTGALAGGGRNGSFQGSLQNGTVSGTYHRTSDNSDGTFTASSCTVPQLTVDYHGTVAGPFGQSGTIALKIVGSRVTGGLALIGASEISLSGTYEASTGTISLTGGIFTFTGQIVDEIFAGSYTTPSVTNGQFSTLNASQFRVSPYCGTYGTAHSGTWNVQISTSGGVSGDYYGSDIGRITGQINGASVSGTAINVNGLGGASFSGTVAVQTTTGSWQATDRSSGTWAGSPCSLPSGF